MLLVERETEIEELGRLYRECLRGKTSIVLISGASGSGKTSLFQTFNEWAINSGATVLTATAFRAEVALPLGILGQLFGDRDLDSWLADPARQLLEDCALIPMLTEHQLKTAVQAQANVFEGLRQLLVQFADNTPVIIGVDDVENADSMSLQCLQYFARRTKNSRILILLSECTPAWSTNSRLDADVLRQPNCHYFQLAPLSQSGVTIMLRELIDDASAQRLAHTFYAASGGNPLLVQGLVDDWRISVVTPPAQAPFGSAFRSAILTCVQRCEPTAQAVAGALAVIGHATTPAIISEMLGLSAESAGHSVAFLDAAGLLDAGWFRHESAAAAVLADMPADERAALHSRAAEVLHRHDVPIDILARHLIDADRIEPSWAVPVLQDAAEQALVRDDVSLAIQCLQRAHEACQSEQQRAVIESALTRVEWRVDPANAARRLPELIQAVLDRRLTGRPATALIGYLLWLGQPSEATEVLAALHSAVPSGEGKGENQLPEVHIARMWATCSYPELAARIPGTVTQSWREVASRISPPYRAEAEMLECALACRADGDAVILAERILEGSRLNDATFAPILAALVVLIDSDQLPRARLWSSQMLADAKARDILLWQAALAAVHSTIEFRQGNLAAAERNAHAALTMLTPRSWGVVIGVPLACLLLATTAAGKHAAASQYLRMPVPETMFQTPVGPLYLQARGKYFLLTGRLRAALADFRSCQELLTGWELDQPGFVPWRTDSAQVWLSMGNNSLARDLAQQQLSLTHAGQYRSRGISLRVLALANAPPGRLALLRQAAEALRESGDRLELAQALADLSLAYQALGEHRRTQVLAHQARLLADQCGAEPLKHTLRPLQPDPGSAGRAEPADAAAQMSRLSDAEQRVARLAAEGYTNQQISHRLQVTVSNVEQHLTRVFRKLGVSSRRDLSPEGLPDLTQPEGTTRPDPPPQP
jgi:DNA-binding CsgD family transcriptional regulator